MPIFPPDPNDRWKPIILIPSDVTSDPTNRNPTLITGIVKMLGPATNTRYLPVGGATFCKTFAEDYCLAMNATFPHWINPDGSPADPGKGAEININMGVDWLDQHGGDYGWEEITGDDILGQIQVATNAGCPVMAVWKNTAGGHGHVMIPLPSPTPVQDLAHLPCAQAGLHNFENGTLANGFGPLIPHVRFFKAP